MERIIDVRINLEAVFDRNDRDCLDASQWSRIENLVSLLLPFVQHIKLLQSHAMSLSNVAPVILNLECHLKQIIQYKTIVEDSLCSLHSCFAKLLDPKSEDFEVIPVAAC